MNAISRVAASKKLRTAAESLFDAVFDVDVDDQVRIQLIVESLHSMAERLAGKPIAETVRPYE